MVNNINNNYKENEFDIDLQRFIKILSRRKNLIITVFSSIFLISSVFLLTKRLLFSSYEGYFILLVTDPLRERSSNKEDLILEEVLNTKYDVDVFTLKELLKSSNNLKELAAKHEYVPESLSKNIKIKEIRENQDESTGILKVSLLTKNPKKDFLLLNDLSKYFLDNSLSQIKINLERGLQFIYKQEPKLIQKREKLQEELVEFRESKSVIVPEDETLSIQEQIKIIKKEINEIKLIQNQLSKINEEIKLGNLTAKEFSDDIGATSKNYNSGLNVSLNINDQKYLEELLSLEEELVSAKFIYKPNSIYINSIQNKINELKPNIKKIQTKSVNNAIQLNESIIKSKSSQLDLLNEEFLSKPSQIKKYNNIISNLDLANKNIEQLNKAREIILLKRAQTNLPWTLLQDPKMSEKPYEPKLRRGFLLIFFVSFITSILVGIFRDRLKNIFHDNLEISDELGLEVIGGIPYINNFSKLNKSNLKFLNFEEESKPENESDKKFSNYLQSILHNIFVSIKFRKKEENFRSIAICSMKKNEGKSLITLLIAKTIFDLGEKVLIIDCDLRNPKITKKLKMENNKGFRNLSQDENELKKYISPHTESGIDILPAGNIKVDPMKTFNKNKLKKILNLIDKQKYYDYVFVDCGSLELPESNLVISDVDKNILLISLFNINKDKCKNFLKKKNFNNKILGVISNIMLHKKENRDINDYYYYEKDQNNTDLNKNKIDEKIIDKKNKFKYFYKLIKDSRKLIKLFYDWIEN